LGQILTLHGHPQHQLVIQDITLAVVVAEFLMVTVQVL
jgi:hypothetical protein